MEEEDSDRKKILESVDTERLFDKTSASIIEWNIDNIVSEARRGKFKTCTVDRAPLRTKYFFGEGYTYGSQLAERGAGNEKLYPRGEVDNIPDWVTELVIKPIEEAGMVRAGWINSAVINDYMPGGCIVSHIDPPQLFSRPIITVSFFSDSYLSFGCKFNFKPIRVSPPIAQVAVKRGHALSMYGHAANKVTHCIRPEDIKERRAVIILRHVPDTAPRMTEEDMEHFRKQEEAKKRERPQSPSRENVYIYDHRKFRSSRPERRPRQRSRSPVRRRPSRDWARGRSRSPGRRRRSPSCDKYASRYHGRRSRSPDKYRDFDKSQRSSESKTSIRSQRRSMSPRRKRSRSRTFSDRSYSSDRFDKTFLEPKFRGLTSRTADKILKRKEAEIKSRGTSVKNEIKERVPVSKSVQSGILKTILGSYEDEDKKEDSSSSEEDNKEALNKVELVFKKRVQSLKHGTHKDRENNEKGKGLEKEVEDLRKELKLLKEQYNENSEDEKSSNSSESESENGNLSVLDIFKTTILQKSTKSSYIINKGKKRSKVSETRTRKILKERIEMLQKK